MTKSAIVKAVRDYRDSYGIFEEELIQKAGLEVDLSGYRRFEGKGDLKALKDGDIERIISFSRLPRGFFDGSLKEAYIEIVNLLKERKEVPQELRDNNEALVSYYHLVKDERFPHSHLWIDLFEKDYARLVVCGELYNIILSQGIEVKDDLPSRERINEIVLGKNDKFNPRELSHGKMLEWHIRAVRYYADRVTKLSADLFGDENFFYKLFKEHRFDKETLKLLRKETGFLKGIHSLKNYYFSDLLSVKADKMYRKDNEICNPSKDLLPAPIPGLYYSYSTTLLYFVIKGFY